MSLARKRVLVFGATGEIGGRIARDAIARGFDVTAVSRGRNTRHAVPVEGARIVHGDKGDEEFLRSAFGAEEFEAVIDSVPQMAHMALAHKVFTGRTAHYLICGSTGIYVPLRYLPADELHPWREDTGVNFHGQSRMDAFALSLWSENKFPVTVLQPTNIIGAGRLPLDGWGGRNPLFFKLLRQGKTVAIPEPGNMLLQSACNDDLAAGFVNAVACGSEIYGETFILSCLKAIPFMQYVEAAKNILQSKSSVEVVSCDEILRRYPTETSKSGLRFLVEHMCFDIGKAQRILGYKPNFTAEQGLAKALEWGLNQGLFDV